MEPDPDRTFRELGFYSATAGSYYKLVPRYLAAHPLSHGQWEVLVGASPAAMVDAFPPSVTSVVFPSEEVAAVWLIAEGLCVRRAYEEATRCQQ